MVGQNTQFSEVDTFSSSPGELHLSPLHGIIQLKPSLVHLDTVARKQGSVSTEAGTDGDTTESEGEDAKPVTVKIARRDAGR